MNRESTPIPEPVAQLQHQLEQFRSSQPGRTKLPESLWQAAVELARQHGVYPVAHPLRLDYTKLKKRLGGSSTFRRKATKPAFVELVAPSRAQLEECVIEWKISQEDILYIRALVERHPNESRRALSTRLCEAWQWRQANGALRDMVCRGMLLMLERAGQITLPPVSYVRHNPLAKRTPPLPAQI